MITYIDPEARYSDATIHNGIIYLGGQVPEDPEADAAAQARSVLAQIDALLSRLNSDKARYPLPRRFRRLRRHEPGLGCLDRAWPCPSPRLRTGGPCQSALESGNPPDGNDKNGRLTKWEKFRAFIKVCMMPTFLRSAKQRKHWPYQVLWLRDFLIRPADKHLYTNSCMLSRANSGEDAFLLTF